MFLSVIIPVYNGERFLADCIESLLHQDLGADDYELVIVDDGSTDNSSSILREYAERYPLIVPLHQENAGVSAARNSGMAAARGDYYWFVDADDLVWPDCLGRLKAICEKEGCDVLSFRLSYFDDKDEETIKKAFEEKKEPKPNSPLRAQPTMLIRKSTIGSQRWHEGIEVGEDALFLRELALKPYRLTEIDDVLYFYRQYPTSSIHQAKNPIKRMFSHVEALTLMQSVYRSEGGRCEANANYLRMFSIFAMSAIARCRAEGRPEWKDALRRLRRNGLFPFTAPKECTSRVNYMTERKDFLGRFLGFLGENAGSRPGFQLLSLWYAVYLRLKGRSSGV